MKRKIEKENKKNSNSVQVLKRDKSTAKRKSGVLKKKFSVKTKPVKPQKILKNVSPSVFADINQGLDFEIEKLLIEEQINYSAKLEDATVNPAINELDKLIEGEKFEINFNELLPQNEIKIKFNDNGDSFTKTNTPQTSYSAYLINLKKQKLSKLEQPPQSALRRFFSDTKPKHFEKLSLPIDTAEQPIIESPSLSSSFSLGIKPCEKVLDLLEKKKFVDHLNDFGSKLYGWIFKLKFKKISKSKSDKTMRSSHLLREVKWFANLKFVLNFALIALLLIAPIRGLFFYKHLTKTKGQVLGVSEEAISELKQGAEAASQFDWQQASNNFTSANSYLSEAYKYLDQYNHNLLQIIKIIPSAGKKLISAENLLLAGQFLSTAAQELTKIFTDSQNNKNLNLTLTEGLVAMQSGLAEVLNNLEKAGYYLKQIDSSVIPENYQDFFVQIQTELPKLENNLSKFKDLYSFSLNVLGHARPMRYLIMFQNPSEIRPTGGFFGSYAILDIKKGEIIKLEVPAGGTYDTKGYMTKRVIAPGPLRLVGSAWSFWDSNWFADFKTSAEKVQWFLEQSGGPTVDGVIAINATLISDLLKIIGDIEMPEYDKVLTPDNVVLALQHATLFEYDKSENKPKEIITDMAPILIERLLSMPSDQILPFILTLNQAFKEKEIQLFFTDEKLQQTANDFGWTGAMLNTDNNYLMVVDANIAGGKTNPYIKTEINHYAYLQPDGSIINTVSITRRHHGDQVAVSDANYVFARSNNVSYTKIYVPLGAELLEVTGQMPPDEELFKPVYENFYDDEYLNMIEGKVVTEPLTKTDIYINEQNKKAFGNWLQVEPGQESTLTFSYRLPKIAAKKSTLDKLYAVLSSHESYPYSLLVQKQSGTSNITFHSFLFLPEDWQVDWLNNTKESNLKQITRGLEFSTELITDQYFAAVLIKD